MNPRLQVDASGAYLVGYGKKMFRRAEETRLELGELFKEDIEKKDGFTIHVRSSESHNFIRITGGTTGFLFHPRSDTATTGLTQDGTAIVAEEYMYPLVDDDGGTRQLRIANAAASYKRTPPENYGNIHWSKDGGGNCTTWRGWPGITIGGSRTDQWEGLTFLDVDTGAAIYYTPLSVWIYQGGNKVQAPGKIRGTGSDGGLIAVVTINYTDWVDGFPSTRQNPSGGQGGYYDEVYRLAGGEWVRLGFRVSPTTNMPVWFNADCTEAQEEEGVWTITATAASFTARTGTGSGQVTITPLSQGWGVEGNGTWQSNFMLTQHGMLTHTISDSTTNSSDTITRSRNVPYLYEKRPDPTSTYIESVGTNVYGLTGWKKLPITWTVSQGAFTTTGDGEEITVDLTGTCGIVVLTATDACGFTATMSIKGATGEYVRTSYEVSDYGPMDHGWYEDTYVAGCITYQRYGLAGQGWGTESCPGCGGCNAYPTNVLFKYRDVSTTTFSCPGCTYTCINSHFCYIYEVYEWQCTT